MSNPDTSMDNLATELLGALEIDPTWFGVSDWSIDGKTITAEMFEYNEKGEVSKKFNVTITRTEVE